jgi:hypothetical protein
MFGLVGASIAQPVVVPIDFEVFWPDVFTANPAL